MKKAIMYVKTLFFTAISLTISAQEDYSWTLSTANSGVIDSSNQIIDLSNEFRGIYLLQIPSEGIKIKLAKEDKI